YLCSRQARGACQASRCWLFFLTAVPPPKTNGSEIDCRWFSRLDVDERATHRIRDGADARKHHTLPQPAARGIGGAGTWPLVAADRLCPEPHALDDHGRPPGAPRTDRGHAEGGWHFHAHHHVRSHVHG